MADPQKYAEWIVANADKKGTPEFDTVAKAYTEARRLQTDAPAEAPAPVTATPTESVTKPRDYAASEVPLEAVSNIPSSAVKTASNLAHMVAHPIDTVKGAWDAAAGGMVNLEAYPVSKFTGKSHKEAVDFITQLDANPDVVKQAVATANDVGGHMAARYGGWEELKRTIAEDPVGAALDISALLSGGAGLARKAGVTEGVDAARWALPQRMEDASRAAVNPVGNAVGNAVGSAIKYPVNKLVDVAGWTFDSLTGNRVPVSTGILARKVVGEGNLEASRNALREQVTPPAAPLEAVPESVNALNPSRPVAAEAQAASAAQSAGALPKPAATLPANASLEGELLGGELAKQGGASGHYAKADADLLNAIDAEFTNVTNMTPRVPEGVTAPQAIIGAGVNAPRVAALQPKIGDAGFQFGKQQSQASDRVAQLGEHTPDLRAALEARAEAAAPLWKAGDSVKKPISPELSKLITDFISPQQRSILEKQASIDGLDFGRVTPTRNINGIDVYPYVSGQSLYNFKRLLDDIVANPGKTNAAEISADTAKKILKRYKPALYKHIPEYGKAAALHAEKSQPINQSIIMNHYANKLRNNLSDVKEGASGFVNLADKMDELPPSVQTALKRNDVRLTGKTVNDILTPEAKDSLANVADQLKRDQRMKDMSSVGGTAELKALMDNTKKIVEYAPLNVLYNVAVKVINKVGIGVSEITKTRLLEAAKTPKEFLKVLDTLPASERLIVLKAIKDAKIQPGALVKPAVISNALAPTQQENKNALTK
jgi:hypothetical protein